MASEQMPRREKVETEIHVEKHLQGGGDNRKEHSGRERKSNEKGTNFESLANKEKERKFYSDRTRDANVVQEKEAEREVGGGNNNRKEHAGKAKEGHEKGTEFESLAEKYRDGNKQKERKFYSDRTRDANVVQDKEAEREVGGGNNNRKGHAGKAREGNEKGTHFEPLANKEKEKKFYSDRTKDANVVQDKEADGRGVHNEGKFEMKAEWKGLGEEARRSREIEETERRKAESEKAIKAMENRGEAKAREHGYVAAKVNAMEKAAQAKDATVEKGQQGYVAAKDTIAGVTKSAADYTAPVAEKAKDYTAKAAEKAKSSGATTAKYVGDKAVQAKDVTAESGKNGAEYAGKMAKDLKDKATAAGWNAAHYSTDKTVEGTKAAANVVQGAAGYAGQKAYELGAKSMDVVKDLAARAGETAKEYTTRKKEEVERELEAKREARNQVGNTEGQVQDNAAQREQREELQRRRESEFRNNTAGQAQGHNATKGIEAMIVTGETAGNAADREQKPYESISGKTCHGGQEVQDSQGKKVGSEAMKTAIGETLGNVAQSMKKPLDIATEGGSKVLGAVGETVAEIGKTMTNPAQKVQQQGQEGKGVGVLSAIGETIAEIAETTKVFVVGEDKTESRQSIGTGSCASGRQGEFKQEQ